jgi:hypothetical protein
MMCRIIDPHRSSSRQVPVGSSVKIWILRESVVREVRTPNQRGWLTGARHTAHLLPANKYDIPVE